jgi:hypothetical protein
LICTPPQILFGIKAIRMKWAVYVARMGERRGGFRVLVGKPDGKNHLEDPDVDGKAILKWSFSMWDGGPWTGLIWLRIGTGGGHL